MTNCYRYLLVLSIVASLVLSARAAHLCCKCPVKDFGKLKEGEEVAHTFEVRNVSNKEIVVNRILSSCGCLVSSKKRFTLKPNESTGIPIEFDSMGYGGKKFEKTIILFIKNSENEVPFRLLIKGEVEGIKIQDRVHLAPEQKNIFGEKDEEHYIFIHAPLKDDLEIDINTPEYIKAKIVKTEENRTLKFTKWHIIFSLTQNVPNRLNAEITVRTNVPFFEKASIPIHIEPKPVVIVSPPILFIRNREPGKLYEKEFEITLLEDSSNKKTTTSSLRNARHTIQAKTHPDPLVVCSGQEIFPFLVEPSNNCIVLELLSVFPDFSKTKYKATIRECAAGRLYLKIMTKDMCIRRIPVIISNSQTQVSCP